MSPPTFSIITAVRNGLADLQHTYKSLQAQTSLDFEWVVVDAASTDGTSDWLANERPECFALTWTSEPDSGISDGWNKALARAVGSQVLILNAGDTYDSNLIERYVSEVGPSYVTCCHVRLLDETGRRLGVLKARPALLWRGMHLPHNWASVPRSFYDEFGNYRPLKHAMDFDWFHRYHKARGVKGFKVLDEVLGSYRLGGHSDRFYREGFRANALILLANGASVPMVALLRLAYTIKHWFWHKSSARTFFE